MSDQMLRYDNLYKKYINATGSTIEAGSILALDLATLDNVIFPTQIGQALIVGISIKKSLTNHPVYICRFGQQEALVDTSNGNITRGDLLTAKGDGTGVSIKRDVDSQTQRPVGTALEDYSSAGIGSIKIDVSTVYLDIISSASGSSSGGSGSTNLVFKEACRVSTTDNIVLSGLQSVDGIDVDSGDRILVKNQTDKSENGIRIASAGAWIRSNDANADDEVTNGLLVFIEDGTVNKNSSWVLATANPIILDTTQLVFTKYSSGGGSSGGTGTADEFLTEVMG